ncbi:D-2-hydroxyacid dehydrogenase [Rothia halotolerans]|uniref:D-2-hydroxyacid dehydrogenase n=1 Tax=Rothia halotolerans TaxID=405770 RepID=UPI00101DE0A8|nr:D-2-hydroxyacid dehydrogenase [Rothia halotolerans]
MVPEGNAESTVRGSDPGEGEDRPVRVVVASPLPEELCASIASAVPGAEVVRRQELYPPMRFPADHAGDPEFTRSEREQREFEEMVDTADVLYGIPDVDPDALRRTVRANGRLRWVQTMAAGGGAQVKAAGLTGEELERVRFTTSAGVHGEPLAEFALFGVLAGAKNLLRLAADQRERHWPRERWFMGQLSEMTVLILGLGGIGRTAARKFGTLGATVWGTSRSGRPVESVDRVVSLDELEDVIGEVDAVVVTLPGTEATEGLLDARLLAACAPGVVVVNVGRGSVIDEPALVEALDEGRVGFAALDVTAREPLPEQSPLWEHPRALISPHTAAQSEHEQRRITELFIRNLKAFMAGGPMENVVDTVEFY